MSHKVQLSDLQVKLQELCQVKKYMAKQKGGKGGFRKGVRGVL